MRIVLSNIPRPLWYCVTVMFVALVVAFTILSVTESDATELRAFINTIMNFFGVLLGSGSLLLAGSAAKNAQEAKEAVGNGQLKRAMTEAIEEDRNGNGKERYHG